MSVGAGRGGVVEQAVEFAVVLRRAGAQIVRRVEQQPQARRVEHAAQRAGVAQRGAAVGEDRARQRVDLHPREAGRLVGGQPRRGGPGVAVDVEAEARVHVRQGCASDAGLCCAGVTAA
jgi:hypothetical protein